MEPSTYIAIAQFANGMLNKPSGKDPMDSLVKMLIALQRQIKVINNKLDLISNQLVKLPDKVEYKRAINNLNAVLEQTHVIYHNYLSDIEEYGEYKGKKRFVQANEQIINNYLSQIRNSFSTLSKCYDAFSLNNTCSLINLDYELSLLINKPSTYIVNQQKRYLDFLKSSVSENNNLCTHANKLLNRNERILNAKWGIRHGSIHRISHGRQTGMYHTVNRVIIEPEFKMRDKDDEISILTNLVYKLGYISHRNLTKCYHGHKMESVQSFPTNLPICQEGEIDSSIPSDCQWMDQKIFLNEYNQNVNIILSNYMTHENCINTIKRIIQIIYKHEE